MDCADQAAVDHLWDRLCDRGSPGRCAWLEDKFGLSWQIVPCAPVRLLSDPDPVKASRVMQAMMPMSRIDIAALERAYDCWRRPQIEPFR